MPFLTAPYLEDDVNYNESDFKKIASMVGVRLVNQILEDACTIANVTQRLGWPWTCVLSVFKDLKNENMSKPPRHALLEYLLQGDEEIFNDTRELATVNATSTPNKGENVKMKHENSLIGQGDEEADVSQTEQNISPSMYINQLFDLSNVDNDDVEEIDQEKTNVNIKSDNETPGITCEIMDKLFQGVVDIATDAQINVVEIDALSETQENIVEIPLDEVLIIDEDINEAEERDVKGKIRDIHYAFIQEAYDTCGLSTVQCFLDKDNDSIDDYVAADTNFVIQEIEDDNAESDAPVRQAKTDEEEKEAKQEVARYEHAYLSLNRDYEQYSDDGNTVLEDPKDSMDLQEVKLFPSSEDSSVCKKEDAGQNLAATSGVSGVSGKSRSSLVSRCKTHGARLLACLRGWWRRKSPGKRKYYFQPIKTGGSIRGICPLSPDARRRAASLLDQRELYSPKSNRALPWKFNTVNESVIKSTQWKEYTYELAEKPDQCDENSLAVKSEERDNIS